MQRNRFAYIEENFFESTKLSSIQRSFFFDCISKNCFFDLKKLFSGCILRNRTKICSKDLFLTMKRYGSFLTYLNRYNDKYHVNNILKHICTSYVGTDGNGLNMPLTNMKSIRLDEKSCQ